MVKVVNLYLEEEEKNTLQNAALDAGLSMRQFCRDAIAEKIARNKNKHKQEENKH